MQVIRIHYADAVSALLYRTASTECRTYPDEAPKTQEVNHFTVRRHYIVHTNTAHAISH